ncbi:MAG TPA: tetratricopeptide repeat protein [Terracidiphilus sp.]|nr:tetratricopeptide repeat protein [Terracidiphilus sp.]
MGRKILLVKHNVNGLFRSLLFAVLAESACGFSQQAPAAKPEPGVAQVLAQVLAEAQQAQATGDYRNAAEFYRKAVEMSPEIPELWANLGLMQQNTGDISAAIRSFEQANRRNPSLYVPNLFLGIDYAHSGQTMKAIPFLTRAEKINRTDPQAPLALGRAYFSAGRFTAAAQELERAIALDPKLGPAWFTEGIARLDQVEVDARTMSEEGKQSPFSGDLYAESLARQSRFGEAASLLKSLLDALTQPPCLRSELGMTLIREHDQQGAAEAFAAERTIHPGCGLALLGQARLAIDKGDNDQAFNTLGELWNRDHGFFAANASVLLEGMAQTESTAFVNQVASAGSPALPAAARDAMLAAFNQSGYAVPEASVAQTDSPPASSNDTLNRTAEEFYAAGQFGLCEERIDAAPKPLNTAHLRLLAACAFFTGDNRGASAAANRLRVLVPHSIEALYWSVQSNERLAFQSLARFQQLDPDSARSHVLLADIYQQLERFDDAEAECEKALAIAPGDPAAMLGLASAYLSNRNSKGAVEIAGKALEKSPDDPELNLIMAEALENQREYDASEPFLFKSLKGKPQMIPRIHALIGKAYAETGKPKEAIEQLKLGESSDVDGSVQYLLARLYRQLGDTKDATEALNRMKLIKQQREARGVKRVEDPDLSPVEAVASQASTP